ncbi:MAG: hypothetical protein IJQ74_04265 [Synergistaceae bacterium]|nr:hypothetical protein [Synergistaceae bacterium]MBQ7267785.1 hypothetical protein [Synergistaceae bacterium]
MLLRLTLRVRSSRLFFLALLAGSTMYLSEYKYWFTLKDYRVESQSQSLEKRFWDVFPKRCLTFWPYLLKDAKGIQEFLERDMPITVETEMNGFLTGSFTTKIQWLSAWVKVNWRGKIWCISRDGRMWLFERGRQNDDAAGKLVWKIPDEGNIASDGVAVQAPMSGVFRSPISTEVIASFLDEFSGCEWFASATDIMWERRAGMNLFILKLSRGGQRFELYLQREKYSGQDIGSMIDALFSRLISEGGNHIIDATYQDKIILRKL